MNGRGIVLGSALSKNVIGTDSTSVMAHLGLEIATSGQTQNGQIVTATYADPETESSRVAPNYQSLDSCLTREMLTARGYAPDYLSRWFQVDRLGCMIHPLTGLRANPSCWPGPGIASPCVPMRSTNDAFMQRLVPFVAKVVEVIGPVVGPALSSLAGSVLNSISSSISSFLGPELKSAIAYVKGIVNQVYAFFANIIEEVKQTAEKVIVSIKTLFDTALNTVTNAVNPAHLISYLGVKEGLSVIQNLGTFDLPSFQMVSDMIGGGININSLTSAMQFRDAQKMFVGLQGSLEGFIYERGSAAPEVISSFFANAANTVPIESFTDIGRLSSVAQGLAGDGMNIAVGLADRFGAKSIQTWSPVAEQMLGTFDPQKLIEIVPSVVKRSEFVAKAREAIGFARSLDSVVKSAWYEVQRVTDLVGGAITSTCGSRIGPGGVLLDASGVPCVRPTLSDADAVTLRQMLTDAEQRANDQVRQAAEGKKSTRNRIIFTPYQANRVLALDLDAKTRGLPHVEKGVK